MKIVVIFIANAYVGISLIQQACYVLVGKGAGVDKVNCTEV